MGAGGGGAIETEWVDKAIQQYTNTLNQYRASQRQVKEDEYTPQALENRPTIKAVELKHAKASSEEKDHIWDNT